MTNPTGRETPLPLKAVYFCKPDGTEINTVDDVAETVVHMVRQGNGVSLFGVLAPDNQPPVVCVTGNGKDSEANAALIVLAVNERPSLLQTIEQLTKALEGALIGGNHLANFLIRKTGADFAKKYPSELDNEEAMRLLIATDTYDVWCAWAALMRARALTTPAPQPSAAEDIIERAATVAANTARRKAGLAPHDTEYFKKFGGYAWEYLLEQMAELSAASLLRTPAEEKTEERNV